jgi:hypothetical protein
MPAFDGVARSLEELVRWVADIQGGSMVHGQVSNEPKRIQTNHFPHPRTLGCSAMNWYTWANTLMG